MTHKHFLWSNFIYWLTIKPRIAKLQKLLPEASIYPFGSRYVCSPPVLTTDIDFMVYSADPVEATLLAAGYKEMNWRNYMGDSSVWKFTTWCKGVVNLVISHDMRFIELNEVATHICKAKNVMRKYHRVLVYETLRGNWIEPPDDMGHELANLLRNLNSPYKTAIYEAYRVQHGLRKGCA